MFEVGKLYYLSHNLPLFGSKEAAISAEDPEEELGGNRLWNFYQTSNIYVTPADPILVLSVEKNCVEIMAVTTRKRFMSGIDKPLLKGWIIVPSWFKLGIVP